MKDLAAGERLGRKFTCVPFIPHGRGLSENLPVTYCENRENLNGDLPHFAHIKLIQGLHSFFKKPSGTHAK